MPGIRCRRVPWRPGVRNRGSWPGIRNIYIFGYSMDRRPPLWYRLRPYWNYLSWVPLLLLLLAALAIYLLDLRTLREAIILVALYLLLTFLFERYVRPRSHGEFTDFFGKRPEVGPVARVWHRWQRELRRRLRHDPFADAPPAGALPLSPQLRERIALEFAATDRTEVERLLLFCPDKNQDADRIRNAVLELAKGNTGEVRIYVEAARDDFRDVLYWAYYRDDDPYPRLSTLIHDLADRTQIDGGAARQLWITHGVTNYRGVLLGLLALLDREKVTLQKEQAAELVWLKNRLDVRP